MDRINALQLVDLVCARSDAQRWARRLELRATLTDGQFDSSALQDAVRDLACQELGEVEASRLLGGEWSVFFGSQRPRGGRGAALASELNGKIHAIRTPDEAYEVAVDLAEHVADLGERVAHELAVEVREACARVGGNPQHKRFRALGVDRPLRRSEVVPPSQGTLVHQPFAGLGGGPRDSDNDEEPCGQAASLEESINNAHDFGRWSRRRQRAQLGVWGGVMRHLRREGRISQARERRVYEGLMRLSRNYRPGHVDAFVLKFEPDDWLAYVLAQQEQLDQAIQEENGSDVSVLAEGDTEEQATECLAALLDLPPHRRQVSWPRQVWAQAARVVQLTADVASLRPFGAPLLQAMRDVPQARRFAKELRAFFGAEWEPEEDAAREEVAPDSAEPDPGLDEDNEGPAELPALARIRPFTAGRKALLLGGDPREAVRQRIEVALELEELEWCEVKSAGGTTLDGIRKSVQQGNVDLVICLARFGQHAFDYKLKDACKEAKVPFVIVEHGYGLSRIARALDEFYGGWTAAASVVAPL